MDNLIEKRGYKDYTIEAYIDSVDESPRDWDGLGTMVLLHNRYSLPNEIDIDPKMFEGWDDLREYIEATYRPVVLLNVYMLDHSGLFLSTADFRDPWDSGQVGFIFISAEDFEKEFGEVNEKNRASAKDCLEDAVRVYGQYLNGEVYWLIVRDADGKVVDSIGGIYGWDYVFEEGERLVDAHIRFLREEERKLELWMPT